MAKWPPAAAAAFRFVFHRPRPSLAIPLQSSRNKTVHRPRPALSFDCAVFVISYFTLSTCAQQKVSRLIASLLFFFFSSLVVLLFFVCVSLSPSFSLSLSASLCGCALFCQATLFGSAFIFLSARWKFQPGSTADTVAWVLSRLLMTVPNGDIAPEVLRVLSLDLRSLLATIKMALILVNKLFRMEFMKAPSSTMA